MTSINGLQFINSGLTGAWPGVAFRDARNINHTHIAMSHSALGTLVFHGPLCSGQGELFKWGELLELTELLSAG